MGILVPPGTFIVNFAIIGRVLLMFVVLGFLLWNLAPGLRHGVIS